MPDLSRQRCFNHAQREAAAVCLECHRFFCRECVTEHEGRVLCVSCLSNQKDLGKKQKGSFSVFRLCLFLGSVFLLWFFFYSLGQLLLRLPVSFHEGTLWKDLWQVL
ncbi:MAG: rhomboid family protein [Desulfobacteraceae bacterium]|nr:rhomboid family protein [Desulfobacteraceae bacterium]